MGLRLFKTEDPLASAPAEVEGVFLLPPAGGQERDPDGWRVPSDTSMASIDALVRAIDTGAPAHTTAVSSARGVKSDRSNGSHASTTLDDIDESSPAASTRRITARSAPTASATAGGSAPGAAAPGPAAGPRGPPRKRPGARSDCGGSSRWAGAAGWRPRGGGAARPARGVARKLPAASGATIWPLYA